MGVKFLETYSKQIGAWERVNILHEIFQYRLNTGKVPIIVIDGVNLLFSIIRSKRLPWLTNSNLFKFKKYLKLFIQNLRKSGAEVLVFFDGSNWMFNSETWINRRKEGINKVHVEIFDRVEKGFTVEEIESTCKPKLIGGAWTVGNHVLIEEGCQVIKTVYDCDYEIAAYVQENQCMALLAHDTDFLIITSCSIYRDWDIDTMTAYKFAKDKLLYSLGLDEKMLPLFATLVGNDIFSSDMIHNFSSSYRKDNVLKMYKYLAHYIASTKINSEISDATLEKVAYDLFHDVHKSGLLRKSIESYNTKSGKIAEALNERLFSTDEKWSAVLKMVYDYHRHGGGRRYIFDIVSLRVFQNVESVEDFRQTAIPPIQKIIRPLRQKIYGILLQEMPGDHIVEEMVVENDEVIKPCYVKAIPPRVAHPGLEILWGKENEELNWRLLGDIMEIETSRIKNLPMHLVVPALAMLYLRKANVIENWETTSVILGAVVVSYMDESSISAIRIRRVQSRALWLCSLVQRMFDTIGTLLESVGNIVPLHKTLPTYYHDGNIFHLIYNAMQLGISSSKILNLGFEAFFKEKIKDCEESFYHILAFVFDE